MSNIIAALNAERMTREIPDFGPGDTVVVEVKVKEGDRERVQAYEGVVIAKSNRGINSSFTVRKISHGERGVDAAVALGNDDAFVRLHALAVAFLDLHFDDDGVAGTEVGDLAGHALGVERGNDVAHFFTLGLQFFPCSCRGASCSAWYSARSLRSSTLNSLCASRSGRRAHVRPSDCLSRQRAIAAWLPPVSTDGTVLPSHASGRV